MGMSGVLSAGFLAGMVSIKGSGHSISEKRESKHASVVTVRCYYRERAVELFCWRNQECLAIEELANHIVTWVFLGSAQFLKMWREIKPWVDLRPPSTLLGNSRQWVRRWSDWSRWKQPLWSYAWNCSLLRLLCSWETPGPNMQAL